MKIKLQNSDEVSSNSLTLSPSSYFFLSWCFFLSISSSTPVHSSAICLIFSSLRLWLFFILETFLVSRHSSSNTNCEPVLSFTSLIQFLSKKKRRQYQLNNRSDLITCSDQLRSRFPAEPIRVSFDNTGLYAYYDANKKGDVLLENNHEPLPYSSELQICKNINNNKSSTRLNYKVENFFSNQMKSINSAEKSQKVLEKTK